MSRDGQINSPEPLCRCIHLEKQNIDIAAKAFRAAAEHLTDLVTRDLANEIVVKNRTGTGEVCDIVTAAKEKYEKAHKGSSKAVKWLQRLSASIHCYSNILDVLVQHHPEYVSLVWGAMKLLFVGVVNHEKTTTLLAKSLAEIAEHLPRWELKSRLYQTAPVQRALEELYSLILEFLSRAYAWYREPRVCRVIHSITQPPELRYNDLLKEISDRSTSIDQLAIAGSQAELRDMHEELRDVRSILRALASRSLPLPLFRSLTAATAFQAIHSSALLNTNARLSDLQLSAVLSIGSQIPLGNPTTCYEHALFYRNRRASGAGAKISTNEFWLSPKLKTWPSSECSGLINIRGSFLSRDVLQDFCVDIIRQLRDASMPVLWALKGAQASGNTSLCSTHEILKYLTLQAIRLNESLHTERDMSLKCSQFQSASTAREWLELFKAAIRGVQASQLYLVLDLETIDSTLQLSEDFNLISELQKAIQALDLRLKVLVVMYSPTSSKCISEDMSDLVIPVRVVGRRKPNPRAVGRTFGGRLVQKGDRREHKAAVRSWGK
ncbi:hypothetical protein CMUS01_03644 [Colletotrichum musicola]|uniref:DUF7708 domain-containing protein n=1 Tax=Colletotrichum musicola TaxID=2175873 RepID=A0A8H6U627_9PEZI|nr:hypothetical protein CMUS01_03644 [Colletotrichum musicola]